MRQIQRHPILLLIVCTVILLIAMLMSIVLGYTNTSLSMTIDSFVRFDGSNEQIIIQELRIPRSLIAAAVGASLAMAGVLMQTLTNNALASPSILGINAGAGFAVVFAVSFFQVTHLQAFAWIAFLGATVAGVTVYAISSIGREGLTPIKITLAGAAMAAMFSSFTQGILVLSESTLEQVLFWLAGSVQGRSIDILLSVLPYFVVGWLSAFLLAGKLNALAMGEDVAKGLGVSTGVVKLATGVVVILLAGGAVAVAGPIGFIGIIIPHIARKLIGIDHKWLIPLSGLLGGILLTIADVGARYLIMPQEVPVGVMTAVIGTPFFIYVARKGLTAK
ncbi:FecCD family ABC transporter permease [Bacillus fonticola]|uniref:FecCD family ABC transporter permease n=1 Tax=Bacillus fonticola TaxID=2728853 RepID=UPI001884CFDB|nr:iron ABC transporter permease [Bacillus fonticola]